MIETGAFTIDPEGFREVMGHHPSGVTAMTGIAGDGEACAMVLIFPPRARRSPSTSSAPPSRWRSAS